MISIANAIMMGRAQGSGGGGVAPTRLVVDTFTANGTWTSPLAGTAQVECWGAGGGGVTATGGGGGGAYSRADVAVTEIGYTVVVGASAAGNGADTTFATTTVVAKGGTGAAGGGAGGQASASTGTVKYDGGNGQVDAGSAYGGGGAGDSGAGALAEPGERNGGRGSAAGFGAYIGSGGGSTSGAGRTSARGECRVTYTRPADPTYPRPQFRTWGRDLTTGTTSRSAPMPSGIVAGELLLMAVASDGAAALDITVSGWNKLGQQINATNTCTLAVFYKTAEGSDTATVETSAAESCTIQVWRIANGGVPEMTTTAGGTSTNPNPPSHVPSTGDAKYLWIALACVDGNGVAPSAAPSGYESWIATPPWHAQGVQLLCAEKFAETDEEDPGVYTQGSAPWCAATVSVPLV